MRQAFIATLVELAEQDERIVFLTGDLGYLAVEPFAERFPKRFFNAGVAEQKGQGREARQSAKDEGLHGICLVKRVEHLHLCLRRSRF